MEKLAEKISETERIIRTSDHMVRSVFPALKDKRILLRAVSELKTAVANCITILLQFEYINKRISLYKDPKANFRTFMEKCAPSHRIENQEIKLIIELFDLEDKRKKSAMEFIRDDKVIILSDKMKPETLTFEKTKEFLELSKNIFRKTANTIQV